jgi:hypothetical protein
MAQQEFILYEQALELKELGFDESCIYRYCIVTKWEEPTSEILLQLSDCESLEKNLVKAPLYQQAFRWFREKYGLVGWVEGNEGKRIFMYRIESPIDSDDQINCFPFRTYEEAEEACINKLIEIANEQSR